MTTTPPPLLDLRHAGLPHLSRREALRRGITDSQLRRWTLAGHLRSLGYGLYELAPESAPSTPWDAARTRHLTRADAIADAIPGSCLTGVSAALAHGLPLVKVPDVVELTRRPYGGCERPGVVLRRPWGEAVERVGRRVQAVADVAVDVAAHHGAEAGLVVADAALRRGLTRERLTERAVVYGRRPGAASARLMTQLADPLIESPAESRVHWALHVAGLSVIPQFEVFDDRGGFVARVDFLVQGSNVIVEMDGLTKYSDERVLRAEKVRQVALERLGFHVVRILYRDLDVPGRVAALVREALARHR